MKNYFYCNSYQAFFMALNIRSTSGDVTVLTSKDDIIKSCEFLSIPFIKLKKYIISNYLLKKSDVKKEINEICSKFKDGKLHFSHTQFDIFCFMIVHNYSKSDGKVLFYNFELVIKNKKPLTYTIKYIKKNLIRLLINISYNIKLVFKYIDSIPVFAINEKFILSNGIEYIDNKDEYYNILFDTAKKESVKIHPIKNLFIAQSFIGSNLVRQNSLIKLYNFLNEFKFVVKQHPNMYNEDFFLNKECFPTYLPAELLLNNVYSTVMSINSVTLITASKFNNIKSVSLMDLVKINNLELGKQIKQLLIEKSENKILFPNNYQELSDILNAK